MTTFTQKEYIEMLEKLVNEQYDDEEETINSNIVNSWIPADPPAKDGMKKVSNDSFIDLTKVKKDKIEDCIYNYRNIRIGKFLLKIIKYSSKPNELQGIYKSDLELNIVIYEDKTPQLSSKVDVKNDIRFTGRSWQSNFNQFKAGMYIDIPSTIDIIRWLQAISRIGCFI